MKKMKSILLVLLIVCTTMLTACGANGQIKNLIKDFETACHTLDFNEILECLDPAVSDTVNSALGLVGMFTEVSNEEMLDQLSTLLVGESDDEDSSSFFSTIEIEIEEIDAGRATATVDAKISYEVNGNLTEEDAEIICNYSDDDEKWYISDISFE